MKIWNIGQAVTREEVIWCYQTLLGREPESENAILPHLESGSFKSLVRSFVSTAEYAARTSALSKIQLYERPEEELPEPAEHVLISPEHNEALAKAEFDAGVFEVHSTDPGNIIALQPALRDVSPGDQRCQAPETHGIGNDRET
jgi:hypothetical protein